MIQVGASPVVGTSLFSAPIGSIKNIYKVLRNSGTEIAPIDESVATVRETPANETEAHRRDRVEAEILGNRIIRNAAVEQILATPANHTAPNLIDGLNVFGGCGSAYIAGCTASKTNEHDNLIGVFATLAEEYAAQTKTTTEALTRMAFNKPTSGRSV